METKICYKCKVEKDTCEFHKDKSRNDGYDSKCKECKKQYYIDNSDRISNRVLFYPDKKVCYKCKIEKNVCEFYKDRTKTDGYNSNCKECNKQYYIDNPNYYNNWNKKNPDKVKLKKEQFSKKNPDYFIKKYHNDLLYKLRVNLRNRINTYLKLNNINKSKKTFDVIGCSPEELKVHIEKQFTDGMNWGNKGLYGWHIDHIIPLSSSNTEEEFYKLCHYTNLQPLWWFDNLSKGSKLDGYKNWELPFVVR